MFIQIPIVIPLLQTGNLLLGDICKMRIGHPVPYFAALFSGFIHGIIRCAENTSVYCSLVNENSVFHIIAGIRHNCHNCIHTIRLLLVVDQVQVSRLQQRNLRIIEKHAHLINPHLIIAMVYGHRLFALTTRKGISGIRVVFWINNHIPHHAEQYGRMNLNMGIPIILFQILFVGGY